MAKKIRVRKKANFRETKNVEDMHLNLLAMRNLVSRNAFNTILGRMFGEDRDYYTALGWNKNPTYEIYYNFFARQDVAKRVISAYPDATWASPPAVVDTVKSGEATPFMEAWNKLVIEKRIFHYMHRADVLSGIGKWGGLVLGFSGSESLKNPVKTTANKELLYLRPATQKTLQISKLEEDSKNKRFMLPLLYQLHSSLTEDNNGVTSMPTTSLQNVPIHYTRVIHIAEGLEENDVVGTPRLKAILNRLLGIDLIAGGGAEMFWRGAFPGLAVVADKDATFLPDDRVALSEEVEEYVHDMKRFIKAQGVDIKTLQASITSPKDALKAQMQLIAVEKKIPLRVLMGTERGELASTQDDRAWHERVQERNINFAEPTILRPTVDRLIDFGVLPAPKNNEYIVLWPDLYTLSAKEQADVAKVKTETMRSYFTSGAEDFFPFSIFLRDMLGYSDEAIEDIEKLGAEKVKEEIDQSEIDEAETFENMAEEENDLECCDDLYEGYINESDLVLFSYAVVGLKEEEKTNASTEYKCRLQPPSKFKKFRRANCYRKSGGKCIDFIFGIKDGKAEVQALRYKKSIWTKAQAKKHCASKKGKFDEGK